MLYEIYCDAFKEKTIKFHNGLNVVLGTNSGDNSIGKSTFMLIIDFVFGGDTYANAPDIIKNVKDHRICFTFVFDDKKYYFARSLFNDKFVDICDENYIQVSSISTKDFRIRLAKEYKLTLPDLSFRDAVGRYIRAYGKDNCIEKKPLNALPEERESNAITALLKLFNEYESIAVLDAKEKASADAISVFQKAQKLNFVSSINKTQYNKNAKEIEALKNEIISLTSNLEQNLIDVDVAASEEALHIKKLLTKAKRHRKVLINKLSAFEENESYKFSITSNTYRELEKFFPTVNLKHITEVEEFHKKISIIYKSQLRKEKALLKKDIDKYSQIILDLEEQLTKLVSNPNLSKIILKKHAESLREMSRMQQENEAYLKQKELKSEHDEDKSNLSKIKFEKLSVLSKTINDEMQRINDVIYDGEYKSPVLGLNERNYSFVTPDDTGTGMAFKGLVVFDLAVLNLTALPILVHDSVVLKQISDNAIERIMEQYVSSGKQIVIALDKQDSYSQSTAKILEENVVLRLYPNGGELFGRSWGKTL